jgi:hypothetical protein
MERMHQPVGMIDMLEIRSDLGAKPTASDRVVRIGAKVHGPTVLDLRDNATGIRTVVRTGPSNG